MAKETKMSINKYAVISGCILATLSFVKEARAIEGTVNNDKVLELKVSNDLNEKVLLTITPQTSKIVGSKAKATYEVPSRSEQGGKPTSILVHVRDFHAKDLKEENEVREIKTFNLSANSEFKILEGKKHKTPSITSNSCSLDNTKKGDAHNITVIDKLGGVGLNCN